MRVLVELLDKEPIENVLGSCIFEPDIVVFLCDKRDSTLVKESAVYRLFRRRGLRTKPRFLYFDTTNPQEIRRVLAAVSWDYPGCIFDFTGGRDLLLLVAGAYCEAHELPGYYIDLPSGRFINVRGCAHLQQRFALPHFMAEDILALTGAAVHGHGHFAPGEMDDTFEDDVLAVWQAVQKNPKSWGHFVSWLQACVNGSPASSLDAAGPLIIQGQNSRARCNPTLLQKLHATGVLTECTLQNGTAALRFKSALHKKCLLNSGIWLELYCYVVAKRSGLFDDVRTSLVIDWSGVDGGRDNTKNEIDVLLVRGVTPVFISCKMSAPSPLALSEVMLLCRKFGGQLGRAAVISGKNLGSSYKALRMRAEDMRVQLIDLQRLQSGQLLAQLEKLFDT